MNVYLSKGFRPLDFETSLDALPLAGDWPADLQGTLYRIGPNPRFRPLEPYNPLMGDGMLHAFSVRGGRISYRNRWVRTRQWHLEDAAGRALFATSGDPRQHDPSVTGQPTDGVANTSVVWHGGRLLALEEGHGPIEVHPASLETIGAWDFQGRLRSNLTAHPKLDPLTGEMVCFANEPRRTFTGEITWFVVDARGAIVLEQHLSTPFASLVHDFAVTRDFVVFVLGPVTISMRRAMRGGPPLAWEPELGTRIAVLRRDGRGPVRWLEHEPAFVWHIANAWNDGSHIVLDVCSQRAPAIPQADGSLPDTRDWQQRLCRWTLDATASGVTATRLHDTVCEYPRIDERWTMRRNRYTYLACHGGPGTDDPFHRGLARFDAHTGVMQQYRFGAATAVSEPVFVAAAPDAVEGEGWLLGVAYDEDRDSSRLVLLDAADLERGPIAEARVPHRVPMGFHGCWLQGDPH